MDYGLERGRSRSGAGRSRRRDGVIELEVDARQVSGRGSGSAPTPKKKPSKTRRRVITMIVAECFALLFIGCYGFFARRWNMIQRVDDWVPEEIENPNFSVDLPQYEKQKGHWGIYIFGVDSRGTNVGKGTNADVNIICDIDHDSGEIRLVSVFRDTYLNINENGSYNKINQAYFEGGPTTAAKMLNKNLDLNISDFVTFNWKAVADGINILGGVDMELSKAEFYYINSFITETAEATGIYSEQLTHAGMNHLNGVQAVAYGRLRLMDTDFARTERQRKVIQAAFEKAKQADLATLNELTLALFPQVATSVDIHDLLSLVGDVGKYHIGETGGFPFARGDKNMGKKGACVIPQTLETNVKELHAFLYGEEDYVLSDTVQTLSAKISSDTGMYTQGVSIDHVSTSGGVIPSGVKPKKAGGSDEDKPKATKEETKEETTEPEEGEPLETRESLEGTEPPDLARPGTTPTRGTPDNGDGSTAPTRGTLDEGGSTTPTRGAPDDGSGSTTPTRGPADGGGTGTTPGDRTDAPTGANGLYPDLPDGGPGQGERPANGSAGGLTPGGNATDTPSGGTGGPSGGAGNSPAGGTGGAPGGALDNPAGSTGTTSGGGAGNVPAGAGGTVPGGPSAGGSTGTSGTGGGPASGPVSPGGGDILTVPEGPRVP